MFTMFKTHAYLLAALFFVAACSGENEKKVAAHPDKVEVKTEEKEEVIPFDDKLELPKGWSVIKDLKGDLDKDGVDERVVVYNCGEIDNANGISCERELRIFRKGKANWDIWKRTKNPLYTSDAGGMMGDPFDNIEIKKGVLVISHMGGSRYKWAMTHRYRFQNDDFYLIGASSTYGTPCEYWQELDYNLSTGNITFDLEPDDCELETYETELPQEFHKKWKKPLKKPIRMVDYHLGEFLIQVPGFDEDTFI